MGVQDGAPTEISLPIFEIRSRLSTAAPPENAASQMLPAVQVLDVALSTGRPQPGALQTEFKEPTADAAGHVFRVEGQFVFCVCHSSLEGLEVPLFYTLVDSKDWCHMPKDLC